MVNVYSATSVVVVVFEKSEKKLTSLFMVTG